MTWSIKTHAAPAEVVQYYLSTDLEILKNQGTKYSKILSSLPQAPETQAYK